MDIKYFDTHAHVNINAFKDDWEEVIATCQEEGVAHTNVGTQRDTSQKAVDIAESYEDGVYAIVGLHPVHTSASYHDEKELGESMKGFTSRGEVFDADFYRELAKSKKVIAIGETGLDYYRLEEDTKDKQMEAFIAQIQLANELNLPLMIHTRDAQGNQSSSRPGLVQKNVYDDVYAVLKQYAKVPFNVHFYAGTYEQAKRFFDLGGTISFTGVITFARDYEEVVKYAPLDLIHAETDCPYVAPVPHRGKRCEPWMVTEVAAKIAEIKGEDEETVRLQLLKNVRKLYGIDI